MKTTYAILLPHLGHMAVASPTPLDPVRGDSSMLTRRDDDGNWAGIVYDNIPDYCKPGLFAISLVTALAPEYRAQAIGTAFAGTATGVTAWKACEAFHHNPDLSQMCSDMGAAVGGLASLVAAGFLTAHTYNSQGVAAADASGQPADAPAKRGDFEALLADDLRKRGLVFDKVNVLGYDKRDADSDSISTSYEILNMRDENGLAVDHLVHMHEDGTGVGKTTIPSPLARRGLEKRHAGPGVKVSYDFPKLWSGDRPEDTPIRIVGDSIGMDWEGTMNRDGGDVNTYFARAAFTDSTTMALRVSIYDTDFDDGYENVHECGKVVG